MMSMSSDMYPVSSFQTLPVHGSSALYVCLENTTHLSDSNDRPKWRPNPILHQIRAIVNSTWDRQVNSPLKEQATEVYHNPAEESVFQAAHRGIFQHGEAGSGEGRDDDMEAAEYFQGYAVPAHSLLRSGLEEHSATVHISGQSATKSRSLTHPGLDNGWAVHISTNCDLDLLERIVYGTDLTTTGGLD
ncbi:hypothetical protein N7501_009287 [Penicillium viridicatum]|nr:hypothetical protein N7501_009287 [Penicillium viridicatum]